MRLILLGPPGSGKGTQAALLCQRNRLEHIGTGDLIRAAIREDTAVGRRARPFVEAGQLVPDDLVNDMIADRFRRNDRPACFVMDGYPRTLQQAATFDTLLRQHGLGLTDVLVMRVDDAEIVRRLRGRQRDDDKDETVLARLQVFKRETAELIPYYQAQGLVREVHATGSVEQVYQDLLKAVGRQAG
jgi:adenylate kinase